VGRPIDIPGQWIASKEPDSSSVAPSPCSVVVKVPWTELPTFVTTTVPVKTSLESAHAESVGHDSVISTAVVFAVALAGRIVDALVAYVPAVSCWMPAMLRVK
jgi:hypothetical protein